MSEANPEYVLAVQKILADFQQDAPEIWKLHEKQVEEVLQKLVREGKIMLGELAAVRDEMVREVGFQAAGDYGLSRGMTGQEIDALVQHILPQETLDAMVQGTPPSRVMIDDLRGRFLVVTLTDDDFEDEDPAELVIEDQS